MGVVALSVMRGEISTARAGQVRLSSGAMEAWARMTGILA